MSKVKEAILNVLSDGKWHSISSIIDEVSKTCRAQRPCIRNTVNSLCGSRSVIREHIPDCRYNSCRYRVVDTSAGFGVSSMTADLNRRLMEARGRNA